MHNRKPGHKIHSEAILQHRWVVEQARAIEVSEKKNPKRTTHATKNKPPILIDRKTSL